MKARDCRVPWTVEYGVRVRSSSICRSMVRRRACVNSSPRLSMGVAFRCCVTVRLCLSSLCFQLRRAPTGRSSKSSIGLAAPPPPHCRSSSSSSEKASSHPLLRDSFKISSILGSKIQSSSSSSSRNVSPKVRPRERDRRGTGGQGTDTGESEQLRL